MKPRPVVYRERDEVEIVTPLFVERVGYALTPRVVLAEVAAALGKDVQALWSKVGELAGQKRSKLDDALLMEESGPESMDPILYQLAYRYVALKGHGGPERTIHTVRRDDLRDKTARVVGKRCVKTGTRYGATGGYDSWTGEWDCEPGGLADERTHVLLTVSFLRTSESFGSIEDTHEIEACHVRKLYDSKGGRYLEGPLAETSS